jgi:hypothetical protein
MVHERVEKDAYLKGWKDSSHFFILVHMRNLKCFHHWFADRTGPKMLLTNGMTWVLTFHSNDVNMTLLTPDEGKLSTIKVNGKTRIHAEKLRKCREDFQGENFTENVNNQGRSVIIAISEGTTQPEVTISVTTDQINDLADLLYDLNTLTPEERIRTFWITDD